MTDKKRKVLAQALASVGPFYVPLIMAGTGLIAASFATDDPTDANGFLAFGIGLTFAGLSLVAIFAAWVEFALPDEGDNP